MQDDSKQARLLGICLTAAIVVAILTTTPLDAHADPGSMWGGLNGIWQKIQMTIQSWFDGPSNDLFWWIRK